MLPTFQKKINDLFGDVKSTGGWIGCGMGYPSTANEH